MARTDVDAVLKSGTAQATTGLLFGVISTSASGDTTLLAAQTTLKIKVVSYTIVVAGAVSVKFKSGAATDITGAMAFATNGGVADNAASWAHLFETAVGQALVLNLSGAVAAGGHFSYFLEA